MSNRFADSLRADQDGTAVAVGFIIRIYYDAWSHERHTSVICSLCRALIRLLKYV